MKKSKLYLAAAALTLLVACGGNESTNTTETGTPLPEAPPPPTEPEAPAAPAEDNTVRLVRLTLQDRLKDDLEKNLVDSLSRQFKYSEFDLNEDGKKEIFVGLTGSYFCGSGGCTQYLLDNEGNVITVFSVSDYPVIVSDSKSNGWRDLIIYSGRKNRLVKFDGKKYPSNPSTLSEFKSTPGDDLPRVLVRENTPTFTF